MVAAANYLAVYTFSSTVFVLVVAVVPVRVIDKVKPSF